MVDWTQSDYANDPDSESPKRDAIPAGESVATEVAKENVPSKKARATRKEMVDWTQSDYANDPDSECPKRDAIPAGESVAKENAPSKKARDENKEIEKDTGDKGKITTDNKKSQGDQQNQSHKSRALSTCRKCRDMCRCNEISDLKNRLEVLESTVKLLASANFEKSVPPSSPATPKAATFASSTVLPKLPTSPFRWPFSSPPSTTSSMTSTKQNSVSSSEELVADLTRMHIVSSNFAAVATAVCTEKELVDCSVSGKRSLHSNITPRPALDAEKVARMQEAFSLYTGQPRKVFVEKVQNLQKFLRQKLKGKYN